MLISCTNHPVCTWPAEQKEAASVYGELVEIPFPAIPARCTSREMDCLVQAYYDKIIKMSPAAVLLQGEFVFCFRLATRLLERHIPVLSAASERISAESEDENGNRIRTSRFQFYGFREYSAEKEEIPQ